MCVQDQQISERRFTDRVLRWSAAITRLCAPVQPEEVYAAATVRLLGSQGVLAVGLSQALCPFGRYANTSGGDRVGKDSALHDFPKGVRPVTGLYPSQTASGRNGQRCGEAQVDEASGETRGNRRNWFRESTREHLLRQTEAANRWKQGSKVASLSQSGNRLRLPESHDSSGGTRAWADAGRQTLQARAQAGGRYGEDRHALGRCAPTMASRRMYMLARNMA